MMQLPWRLLSVEGGAPIGTSMTDHEAEVLADLARGQYALEVGSAYGFSAITMAQTARHVIAVDPHCFLLPQVSEAHRDRDSLADMRANITEYGLERDVHVVVGYSQDVLPTLKIIGARFGVIFIDGDHGEQSVMNDVLMAWDLLGPDGVLVCHDYGEDTCPGVAKALDRFGYFDELIDTLWVRWKRPANTSLEESSDASARCDVPTRA